MKRKREDDEVRHQTRNRFCYKGRLEVKKTVLKSVSDKILSKKSNFVMLFRYVFL